MCCWCWFDWDWDWDDWDGGGWDGKREDEWFPDDDEETGFWWPLYEPPNKDKGELVLKTAAVVNGFLKYGLLK